MHCGVISSRLRDLETDRVIRTMRDLPEARTYLFDTRLGHGQIAAFPIDTVAR